MAEELKALSREAILECKDELVERVDVPEWGGYLFVRSISADARDRIEAASIEVRGKTRVLRLEGVRARLVAAACCDEKGEPLFLPADVAALGKKSGVAMERVVKVAQRLSGMTEDATQAQAEALKNAPPAASPSA